MYDVQWNTEKRYGFWTMWWYIYSVTHSVCGRRVREHSILLWMVNGPSMGWRDKGTHCARLSMWVLSTEVTTGSRACMYLHSHTCTHTRTQIITTLILLVVVIHILVKSSLIHESWLNHINTHLEVLWIVILGNNLKAAWESTFQVNCSAF